PPGSAGVSPAFKSNGPKVRPHLGGVEGRQGGPRGRSPARTDGGCLADLHSLPPRWPTYLRPPKSPPRLPRPSPQEGRAFGPFDLNAGETPALPGGACRDIPGKRPARRAVDPLTG